MTKIRAIIILVLFFMAITMMASVVTPFDANAQGFVLPKSGAVYNKNAYSLTGQGVVQQSRANFAKIRDLFQ